MTCVCGECEVTGKVQNCIWSHCIIIPATEALTCGCHESLLPQRSRNSDRKHNLQFPKKSEWKKKQRLITILTNFAC